MAKASADIRSLARNHTEEAIDRLAYWMRQDNPRASVGASIALIERGWGKPTQPIAGDQDNPLQVIQRIERVLTRSPNSNG